MRCPGRLLVHGQTHDLLNFLRRDPRFAATTQPYLAELGQPLRGEPIPPGPDRDRRNSDVRGDLGVGLYFPHNDGVVSKVAEAELALKLDAHYSKNDVLRMYLADVYFGHGFYGLPAAAHGYFGVTAAQLSWPQASMLAGLVQSSSTYDPIRHLSTGRLRQRHVLNRLVATHVLSAAQADAAFAAPLGLR